MAHVVYVNVVTKEMALLPNAGSDKAWVWTVQADYADEQPKVEQLAIKFKNAESKSPPCENDMHQVLMLFTSM